MGLVLVVLMMVVAFKNDIVRLLEALSPAPSHWRSFGGLSPPEGSGIFKGYQTT